jgi:hypothetical protein
MIYTVSKGCGDYNGIHPLAVVQWSGFSRYFVFSPLICSTALHNQNLSQLRLIQFAKMLLATRAARPICTLLAWPDIELLQIQVPMTRRLLH